MKNRLHYSKAGLDRLRDAMAGYVERGEMPGIVTLLCHREGVYVDAFGSLALDSAAPMRRDTIFRISSMTKPITGAAAMLLVEEGKLGLDEAIDGFLPELASRRVLRRVDGPLDDTLPAARALTLRDLLTFQLGFGLVMAPPDTYPIQKAVTQLELGTMSPPFPQVPPAPDEWIRRFGTLPLMHQPGERFMYNTGAQVLSVLIARASGQSFQAFLRDRIFDPLGMKDTSFFVPAGKLERLATSYAVAPDAGSLSVFDPVEGSQWGKPPAFADGAAGLVSTVDDYLAFARMLLHRGLHRKTRILSEASVEAMTTDQMTPAQKAASTDFVPGFFNDHGWGLCMAIVTCGDDITQVPGRFGWDGGLGTSAYIDPKADLVGILMTQRMWTSASPPKVRDDFWKLAYRGFDG